MSLFRTIAVWGRYRAKACATTVKSLLHFLEKQQLQLYLDADTAKNFMITGVKTYSRTQLPACDLLIVVGGDGSLLGAARAAVEMSVPVVGINRGALGFLADISPRDFEQGVASILAGEYEKECRFLLDICLLDPQGEVSTHLTALNDCVLMPGEVPHMISFEISINGRLMCEQRADGLIVATPTGSTAYALSAGGPILHPQLDAMVLVPMLPHKLSSRPIVIDGSNEVCLKIAAGLESPASVSCDGQARIKLSDQMLLKITKKKAQLCLLHPKPYNYFETLRNKLGWEKG